MLIAKSRKNDRKSERKGDKMQREQSRKRSALVRRILFVVLIVGVLGVFLYNNRDYFLGSGDSADMGPKLANHFAGKKAEREGADGAAAVPKPKKAKKAKGAKDYSGGGPVGGKDTVRRSVGEVLGGLEFGAGKDTAHSVQRTARSAQLVAPASTLADKDVASTSTRKGLNTAPAAKSVRVGKDTALAAASVRVGKDTALASTPTRARPDSAHGDADSAVIVAKSMVDSARADTGSMDFFARLGLGRVVGLWEGGLEWGAGRINSGVELVRGIGSVKRSDVSFEGIGAGLLARYRAVRAYWDGAGLRLQSLWRSIGLDEFWDAVDPRVLLSAGRYSVSAADTVRRVAAAPAYAATAAQVGSFFLPGISCNLGDREDLRVSISIELLFDGADELAGELDFKRGVLLAVAVAVMQKQEYGNIDMPRLSVSLLNSFNGQLSLGQLSRVDIKEFKVDGVGDVRL